MSDQNKSYDRVLFGICNPLLDISANVPLEMVTKYDVRFGSAIMAEEKQLPIYDELVSNYNVEYIAGGATQNVFRVFQWMMQTDKPAATFLGCVGNDKFGEELKKNAEKDGLHVEYQVDDKAPTGTCAVLVVGKERSLVANLGAANNYSHDHFKSEKIQQLFHKALFYYFSGFFLTVQPQTMLEVGQHAAEENKIFCLNLSAPFVIQFFKDKLMALLPYTDYLFGNEEEARIFAASMGWEVRHNFFVPLFNKERPLMLLILQSKHLCWRKLTIRERERSYSRKDHIMFASDMTEKLTKSP